MAFADEMWTRLSDEFGEEWHRISESAEAYEDEPLGAWLVVEVAGLHLRLVRDRGYDHVDVKCNDGANKRWVPIEVVAVALDRSRLDAYVKAFEETLKADGECLPENAAMLPLENAIAFVREKVDRLPKLATDANRIRDAEGCIVAATQPILERHGSDPD